MRFTIGRTYRDLKNRDGEAVYIAAALYPEEGNLVDMREGLTFFAEDAPLYAYEGADARAMTCFDMEPIAPENHEFVECDVTIVIEALHDREVEDSES